jgi:hypothetical protein
MSFSSNGTLSLCSKMEGEIVGSSRTGCVSNLPIKKKWVRYFRERKREPYDEVINTLESTMSLCKFAK